MAETIIPAILSVYDENGNKIPIPAIQGEKGEPGEKGEQGEKGKDGEPGPAGPPGSVTNIDDTLTKAGYAADAKTTGDKIRENNVIYGDPYIPLTYVGLMYNGEQVYPGNDNYDGFLIKIIKPEFNIHISKNINIVDLSYYEHIPKAWEKAFANIPQYKDSVFNAKDFPTAQYALITVRKSETDISQCYYVQENRISVNENNIKKNEQKQADDKEIILNNKYHVDNDLGITGRNCPIVCFVYDNTPDELKWMTDYLEKYGLKMTFATTGSIAPNDARWTKIIGQMKELAKSGHGVAAHGPIGGVTPIGSYYGGIDTMCDFDARAEIAGGVEAYEMYGLPGNGITYWTTWTHNPHTISVIGRYFDYGIVHNGNAPHVGINYLSDDVYKLSRWLTDDLSDTDDIVLNKGKAVIDECIGKNVVLIFGSHQQRTPKQAFYKLVDYLGEKVKSGLFIPMSTDDAMREFAERKANLGIIPTYKPYVPFVGCQYIDEETGVKTCTNAGQKAIHKITLSGTPTNGNLKIDGYRININTVADDTIASVIDKIMLGVYTDFTFRKLGENEILAYCDSTKAVEVPAISNNTTGLSVNITEVTAGVDPTWI